MKTESKSTFYWGNSLVYKNDKIELENMEIVNLEKKEDGTETITLRPRVEASTNVIATAALQKEVEAELAKTEEDEEEKVEALAKVVKNGNSK